MILEPKPVSSSVFVGFLLQSPKGGVLFLLYFASFFFKPRGWEPLFLGLPNLHAPKRRRRRTSQTSRPPRLRLPRPAARLGLPDLLGLAQHHLSATWFLGRGGETKPPPQKKKRKVVVLYGGFLFLGFPRHATIKGKPHEKNKTQRTGVCSSVGRSNSAWPARGQRKGTRKNMGPRLQQTNSCLDVCRFSFLCFLF